MSLPSGLSMQSATRPKSALLTKDGQRAPLDAGSPRRELAADKRLLLSHVEVFQDCGVRDVHDLKV